MKVPVLIFHSTNQNSTTLIYNYIITCSVTSPLYVANHHKDLCCISIHQVSSQTCVALNTEKLGQR